jgi:rhodanese-related sulfurtransferase
MTAETIERSREGSARKRRCCRAIGLLLALVGLLPGCSTLQVWSKPDWPGVKRLVREQFPEVSQMTTAELAARLSEESDAPPRLLDARSPAEFQVSHLRGALSTPSTAAADRALASDKNQLVVVYCSVGYRSAALARALLRRGYSNVFNLEGSIFEWANMGLPVYRGGRPVQAVHPYGAPWSRLLDRKLWSAATALSPPTYFFRVSFT